MAGSASSGADKVKGLSRRNKLSLKQQVKLVYAFVAHKVRQHATIDHFYLVGCAIFFVCCFIGLFPFDGYYYRRFFIQLTALLGLMVSGYALLVEYNLKMTFKYQPLCNTEASSCSAVFTSEQSHILSYWGLVEKSGDYDLSLATLGLGMYFFILVLFVLRIRIPYQRHFPSSCVFKFDDFLSLSPWSA